MRTTLNIDDDVLQAAKELSRRNKKNLGEVVSDLARKSLTGSVPSGQVREPKPFYGIQPFPAVPGVMVTNEMIDELREEDV